MAASVLRYSSSVYPWSTFVSMNAAKSRTRRPVVIARRVSWSQLAGQRWGR